MIESSEIAPALVSGDLIGHLKMEYRPTASSAGVPPPSLEPGTKQTKSGLERLRRGRVGAEAFPTARENVELESLLNRDGRL